MITLRPEFYDRQLLCPRCGDDGTGTRFMICAEGVPHEGSCTRYRYDGDVCSSCAVECGWAVAS